MRDLQAAEGCRGPSLRQPQGGYRGLVPGRGGWGGDGKVWRTDWRPENPRAGERRRRFAKGHLWGVSFACSFSSWKGGEFLANVSAPRRLLRLILRRLSTSPLPCSSEKMPRDSCWGEGILATPFLGAALRAGLPACSGGSSSGLPDSSFA